MRPNRRPLDPRLLRLALLAAAQSTPITSSAPPPTTNYLLAANGVDILTTDFGDRLING